MLVTMILAALVVDGLFSAAGLIPTSRAQPRPTSSARSQLDYKLVLNLIATGVFARSDRG